MLVCNFYNNRIKNRNLPYISIAFSKGYNSSKISLLTSPSINSKHLTPISKSTHADCCSCTITWNKPIYTYRSPTTSKREMLLSKKQLSFSTKIGSENNIISSTISTSTSKPEKLISSTTMESYPGMKIRFSSIKSRRSYPPSKTCSGRYKPSSAWRNPSAKPSPRSSNPSNSSSTKSGTPSAPRSSRKKCTCTSSAGGKAASATTHKFYNYCPPSPCT